MTKADDPDTWCPSSETTVHEAVTLRCPSKVAVGVITNRVPETSARLGISWPAAPRSIAATNSTFSEKVT
jgi:hypothetical protein